MKPVIVLDFDGTVVDFSERSYRCYQYCLQRMGIPIPLDFTAYWNRKRARTSMHDILGPYASRLDEYHALWMEQIENPFFLKFDQLFPETQCWLEKARETYDLFLITRRQFWERLLHEMESLGIRDIFSRILVASGTGKSKDSELQAQSDYASLSLIAWIGDTEDDRVAARNLSIPFLFVASGVRDRNSILPYQPDFVFDFLRDIDLRFFLRLSMAGEAS